MCLFQIVCLPRQMCKSKRFLVDFHIHNRTPRTLLSPGNLQVVFDDSRLVKRSASRYMLTCSEFQAFMNFCALFMSLCSPSKNV